MSSRPLRWVSEIRAASSFWLLSSSLLPVPPLCREQPTLLCLEAITHKWMNIISVALLDSEILGYRGHVCQHWSVCSYLSNPLIRNQAKVDAAHTMKVHGGVDVRLHWFLTSTLDGFEWSASWPGRCIPGIMWYPLIGLSAGVGT